MLLYFCIMLAKVNSSAVVGLDAVPIEIQVDIIFQLIDRSSYLWYYTYMKDLIIQDPNILGGKPIISGTRMSVEVILELLAGGMDIKEILKEYSFLTKKQVEAAIDYAAKIIRKEESYIFNKAHIKRHEVYSGR